MINLIDMINFLELKILLDLKWSIINLFLELKILDSWSKLKIKLVHF